MQIIAMTGLARSGKDTVAAWFVQEKGFVRVAFADHLKKCAAQLFGFPYSWIMNGEYNRVVLPWDKTVREILQLFGTECMRNGFDEDFWVVSLRQKIYAAGNDNHCPGMVISDCRFNNEAQMVKELGGQVIEVTRPGVVKMSHASESGIDREYIDSTIQNNGTLSELYALLEREYGGVMDEEAKLLAAIS